MNVRRKYNMKKLIIILTLLFNIVLCHAASIYPRDCIQKYMGESAISYTCKSYVKEIEEIYVSWYNFGEVNCIGFITFTNGIGVIFDAEKVVIESNEYRGNIAVFNTKEAIRYCNEIRSELKRNIIKSEYSDD